MLDKKNTVAKMQKKVEKLGELKEMMDAYGSDAENQADNFVDNDGNPINFQKPKLKMCPNIQKKRTYAEDGVDMKTENKYYVDAKISRQYMLDHATGKKKCVVCPNGKNCPHGHSAIDLDFTKLKNKIQNLSGVIKVQSTKMKNDKPLEPWKPCAQSFSAADLPDHGKKKKAANENEEEAEKGDKRKSILERENVFRKPYEKE